MNYFQIQTMAVTIFPITVIYCLLSCKPNKYVTARYIILTIAALFCYYSNARNYYLLFTLSVLANVLVGRGICRLESQKRRKLLFILAIAADVMILAAAKVMTFKKNDFIMPLGLSFFTFREISYLADMYTGKVKPFDNMLGDVVYITMFTQLQSGPIMKYSDFVGADMYRGGFLSRENIDSLTNGAQRFMIGFAKKVIIADSLAKIANKMFGMDADALSPEFAWIGAIAFSLQLYYDFSGYSDMAIGFTNILGYKCPENFNYPYISASISEFWRRWHITLGAWFREYIYFPLGGSRVNKGRVVLNLFVVWLLTGLWHGSHLSFVVWGMIHFVFAVTEHFTGIAKTKNKAARAIWRIVTLLAVVLAWVMFRAEGVSHGLLYIKAMFVRLGGVSAGMAFNYIKPNLWLMITAVLFSLPVVPKVKEKMSGTKLRAVYNTAYSIAAVLLFAAALALMASGSINTFAYANF